MTAAFVEAEMHLARYLSPVLVACLFGCGPSKPNIDEKATLRAFGFYDPIVVSAPLNTSDGLLALFRKTGYVAIIPDTTRTPWWTFGDFASGAPIGGPLQIAVGHRVVTGHSEERTWSNGSQEQYAVTITYSIELDQKITKVTDTRFEDRTLRLVLINDPTVGRWQVSSDATHYGASDSDDVAQKLSVVGQTFLDKIPQAISEATREADNQIAAAISNETGLKPSSNGGNLLISAKTGLAYLRAVTELRDGATLKDARTYCANATAANLTWRLATLAEAAATAARVNGAWRMDSPSGQIWKLPASCSNCMQRKFIVDSFLLDPGHNSIVTDHPDGDQPPQNGPWVYVLYENDLGGVTRDTMYGSGEATLNDLKLAWSNGGGSTTNTRPVCVANTALGVRTGE